MLAALFVVAVADRHLGGVEPAAPAVRRSPARSASTTASWSLFLVGPAIPVLAFGQFGDALQTVALGIALLALRLPLVVSYGLGPMIRWGAQRGRGQLTGLGPLVARALPLLLLFTTFLFINAEVWQVPGTLDGIPYVAVIAIFFGLGATFVLTRVPGYIRQENHFDVVGRDRRPRRRHAGRRRRRAARAAARDRSTRCSIRQRFNIGLIVVFGQALQITLVVVALMGFFVAVRGAGDPRSRRSRAGPGSTDVSVLADLEISGRTLVLTEPLIRVSVFLGAFAGMYFTVVLSTDDTYRNEFADDVGPEIRQALAVREAYRHLRAEHPTAPAPAV